MLAVGITTAITLTVSQAISHSQKAEKKAQSEQSDAKKDNAAFVAVTPDAVLSANHIQLNEITTWFIQIIAGADEDTEILHDGPALILDCFKVLFRATIISPNAP